MRPQRRADQRLQDFVQLIASRFRFDVLQNPVGEQRQADSITLHERQVGNRGNQAGIQNVKLYALALQKFMQQEAMTQAQMQAAAPKPHRLQPDQFQAVRLGEISEFLTGEAFGLVV